MVLSYNFLEFGSDHLSQCNTWITPVVIRTALIKKCMGGWSNILSRYLLLHLSGATGVQTAGVVVTSNGQSFLIFAKLVTLISDGEGLKFALDWKGPSGLKPCFKHHNVWAKGSDLAHRAVGHVELTCANPAEFKRFTKAEFESSVDTVLEASRRVRAGTMMQGRLETIEMTMGFNANQHGLVANRELRQLFSVSHVVIYDWVHTMLQDGFMSTEVWRFLDNCSQTLVPDVFTMDSVRSYLKDDSWRWPGHARSSGVGLHRLFQASCVEKMRENNKIRSNSSEMLSLYIIIRHFIHTHIGHRPEVEVARKSFDAACRVVDTMQLTKTGVLSMTDGAARLRTVYSGYLQKRNLAYGDRFFTPKGHWVWDIADQLEEQPLVVDQFPMERNHQNNKAIAQCITNTHRFERSVLAGVMNAQRNRINASTRLGCDLIPPVLDMPGCPGAFLSASLQFSGQVVGVGDLVMRGEQAGQVSPFDHRSPI